MQTVAAGCRFDRNSPGRGTDTKTTTLPDGRTCTVVDIFIVVDCSLHGGVPVCELHRAEALTRRPRHGGRQSTTEDRVCRDQSDHSRLPEVGPQKATNGWTTGWIILTPTHAPTTAFPWYRVLDHRHPPLRFTQNTVVSNYETDPNFHKRGPGIWYMRGGIHTRFAREPPRSRRQTGTIPLKDASQRTHMVHTHDQE